MPEDTPLAQTQDDIRAAQALPDSPDRRARGAAAQTRAREILQDPASTPEQKSAARLAFKHARDTSLAALRAELNNLPG